MQSKSSLLLRVMLNRFHPGAAQAFLKFLPQETSKEVAALATQSQDLEPAFSWKKELITRTHYSWLAPVINSLPKMIQGPALSALPQNQSAGLSRLLLIPVPSNEPTEKTKTFLFNQVYNSWHPEEALPVAYLPQSSLSALLGLTKAELVNLIDLLAMYDLSEAIRHIVDKKYLKNIYLCLTPQKQQFLRICLHKKEKLAAPKLEIEKWDGSPNKLHTILHRRGMLRLGKALCGQSRQFLWLITHTLDTGRGETVAHYYKEEETPGTTAVLALQVTSVINFIKGKSEA